MMLALLASAAVSAAGVPDVSTQADFRQNVLMVHNAERAQVGTPPLVWNDALARDAAVYARHLADTNSWEHDPNNEDQGENLWMGSRGRYSWTQMMNAWMSEKTLLRGMDRWQENFHAVGHFTQSIWHSTRQVGCSIASNRSFDYLVCRYDPAGNVMGESPVAGQKPRRPTYTVNFDKVSKGRDDGW